MSTTSRTSRVTQEGSASPLLIFFLVVLSFAAGAAASWWYLTHRPVTTASAPSPAPDFSPLTPGLVEASPEVAPPASPSAPVVADGAAAVPPVVPPRAGTTGPRPKPAAKPPVTIPVAPLPPAAGPASIRTFVLGTTIMESLRSVGHDLDGFETSGVGVKRAPKVEGQIELVMQPAAVEAGKPYSVMVYLKNDGKKAIDVDEMKVSMIVDGKWSTRPLPPKARQVRPKQRVLLEELPGVWRPGVSDWAVEAVVTSKGQDVYRNRLTWQ
jgi:archaellum component FlaG (FlaF/FlaG flagellin family)